MQVKNNGYIAFNGMNFAYYKVNDENEVNQLFYKKYSMYPKITINFKDILKLLGLETVIILSSIFIGKSIQLNQDIPKITKHKELKEKIVALSKRLEVVEAIAKESSSEACRLGSSTGGRNLQKLSKLAN